MNDEEVFDGQRSSRTSAKMVLRFESVLDRESWSSLYREIDSSIILFYQPEYNIPPCACTLTLVP